MSHLQILSCFCQVSHSQRVSLQFHAGTQRNAQHQGAGDDAEPGAKAAKKKPKAAAGKAKKAPAAKRGGAGGKPAKKMPAKAAGKAKK